MHWRLRRAWRDLARGASPASGGPLVETFLSGQSVRATTYHHRPTGTSGGPDAWAATEDALRQHMAEQERKLRRAQGQPGLLDQLAEAFTEDDAGDDEEGYSDDLE